MFYQDLNPLLPHRFIFFADFGGPEAPSPDEAGEGGGGISEAAAEQAAEERRQSRQAAKKQRKEERKVKKRDHRLADIIQSFIHNGKKDDRMALLLSRLFQRNTPSPLLLAVLSLKYPEIIEVLEDYLEDEQDVMPDDSPEKVSFEGDTAALVQYGHELTQTLALWTRRIFTHASFRPMKSIIALAHHHGVDHNMIELTSLMVSEYFQNSSQEVEFERIREFSEIFWKDALKRLHHLAGERGLLADPNQDPMDEDEEDDEDEDEEDEDDE